MNTKIRELAERAFNHCCETYKDADGPVPWVWEEKFAELIIQECLKIVLQSASVPYKTELATAEATRIYEKIVDAFGVEHIEL